MNEIDESNLTDQDKEQIREQLSKSLRPKSMLGPLISATNLRSLGYWRKEEVSLEKDQLPYPTDFIDPDFDPALKAKIIAYVLDCYRFTQWLGYAGCRICGEMLGTCCMSDGIFRFPQRFEHYIEKHNVRPPQEFIDHIIKSQAVVVYTIGHRKNYDQALYDADAADQGCYAMKMGKNGDYDGGWIWKTAEEAQAFIVSPAFLKVDWGDGKLRDSKDFSVYKVRLENGWKDISKVPGEDGIFNLLVDSRFYR